ncbi:MAG: DUF4147 domain-containing protein, partial [Myxococcales bacterium]
MAVLESLFRRTLSGLSGRALVARALEGRALRADDVLLVALGKAAGPMVQGACDALGPHVRGVAASHVAWPVPDGVTLYEGGHPLPDARSVVAGQALLEAVRGRGARMPLFLVSGGGSGLTWRAASGRRPSDATRG